MRKMRNKVSLLGAWVVPENSVEGLLFIPSSNEIDAAILWVIIAYSILNGSAQAFQILTFRNGLLKIDPFNFSQAFVTVEATKNVDFTPNIREHKA